MLRSIKALTSLLGLTALAVAAPVELAQNALELAPNSAVAKPGGNGKGRGHGRGHASENEAFESQSSANGQAVGHAPSDAVSGVEQTAPGQAKKASATGYSGDLGMTGSINAVHSAAINKGVVSSNSQVAKVEAYVNAAQDLSNMETSEAAVAEADMQAAIEAAALAAANASNKTVTSDMLDQVNAYSNERGLTSPGIDVSPGTQEDVAEQARAYQNGS